MHWFDVKESYFNAYREQMDPFYKDPNGLILDYDEVEQCRILYKEPYYLEEIRDLIEPEGHKYFIATPDDWSCIKRQLRSLKRVGVMVSVLYIIFKNFNF